MNDQQKWFSLRGEQYQYDGGWWRKWEPSHNELIPESYCIQGADGKWCHVHNEKGGVVDGECIGSNDYRVPCSQPFQVGDKVRCEGISGGGLIIEVSSDVCVNVRSDNWILFFDPRFLEPAPPSTPDYTPPDGWSIKESGFVTEGDAFSHKRNGKQHVPPNPCFNSVVGKSVDYVRTLDMPNGGYILTPIVSPPATPQPDVSQEQQTDDMAGWEIYEPVEKQPYSPGTQYKLKSDARDNWTNPDADDPAVHGVSGYDSHFIYRRPIQKPVVTTSADGLYRQIRAVERNPLDIDLLSIERKINLAAKDNPALLDWWRGAKETLAIEAG